MSDTTIGQTPQRRRWQRAALLLALALACSAAGACEIWRDPWGVYRGNCELSAVFKDKFRNEVEFVAAASRYRINLPNLKIHKFKYFTTLFDQVQIEVDVENDGVRDSRAVDVALMINVMDPASGQQSGNTHAATASVPALTPGTRQRIYVTTVYLPNRTQDWDLVTVGVVDPTTSAQPTWGAMVESNESDNSLTYTCRVYGQNPEVTGPPACD